MRNFPLTSIHPLAAGAATAAECIAALGGNDDYWKYVDAVYTNQNSLSTDYERQVAISFGISAAAYDDCVAKNPYQTRIEGDSGDAIASGGTGTPFTVVYSAKYQAAVPGAFPEDQFQAVIQSVKNRQ
jgi:protein-disulfide isomerase